MLCLPSLKTDAQQYPPPPPPPQAAIFRGKSHSSVGLTSEYKCIQLGCQSMNHKSNGFQLNGKKLSHWGS